MSIYTSSNGLIHVLPPWFVSYLLVYYWLVGLTYTGNVHVMYKTMITHKARLLSADSHTYIPCQFRDNLSISSILLATSDMVGCVQAQLNAQAMTRNRQNLHLSR